MRLLTFNLWHGLSPTSPLAFTALEPEERRRLRHELQVEVLRQAQPDIAFFQEVNPVVRRAPALARALDLDYAFQPDLVGLKLFGLGLPLNLNSGLTILAARHLELRRREGFSLSRPGPNLVQAWGSWQLKEERFALFAEAQIPDFGRVLLVDTHLHHGLELTEDFNATVGQVGEELKLPPETLTELRGRLALGNERRLTEMGRLLKRVETLTQTSGEPFTAIILGGDFNASPSSGLSQMLRDAGYRDAWQEAHPNEPGYSFDATQNPANHLLQSEFPLTVMVEDLSFSGKVKETLLKVAREQEYRPRRIDYIWIKSDHGRVRSAELIGQPDGEGLAPSDHFGVLVDFEPKDERENDGTNRTRSAR